ncbi:MAG: M14 family metallopeptidase [Saprospiraceae bacterium]|nr:M14 family metallopeptidase [Saprospiraceae bacterium]
MRSSLLLLLLIGLLPYLNGQSPLTVFERSKGLETATYEEGIAYYQKLSQAYAQKAQLQPFGLTDSGKPLHLFTISSDGDFDFDNIHAKGKLVLLINNAIHPGEPDGVEASMMLARELLSKPKAYSAFLDQVVVAIIPFYSIGGVLNRNSHTRANQNGPVSYGFRGNGRHYDLNRDFIKADTRNARSFTEIFHAVDPEVFIDTHTSNGADYQYTLTIIPTQKDKLGGPLGEYLDQKMMPFLFDYMANSPYEMTPYVNSLGRTPDAKGITDFLESPRYSTGYAALFHCIGFMPETHMLKPFKKRVESTYTFMQGIVKILIRDAADIVNRKKESKALVAKQKDFPLQWKRDTATYKLIDFKGYTATTTTSAISGLPRLKYDRQQPFTKQIPYYNHYIPTSSVERPKAYLISQAWHTVIDRLRENGVSMQRLHADTTIEVTVYYLDDFKTRTRPYEGHYMHYQTKVRAEKKAVSFRAGDWLIPTTQWTNRFIIEILEPEGPDSFFSWNYFDSILQQKEHFSSYVFEDKALEWLEEMPALKADLEKRKKEDPKFAKNGRAQLDFIYKRTPHYEKEHLRYPVFRIE